MSEVTLVGIAGWARSGKDTAAQGLVDIGWTKAAFADPIKRALEILNPIVDVEYDGIGVSEERLSDLLSCSWGQDWQYAKTSDEVRRLLQVFGTEVGRGLFGEDFWVKQALDGAYPYTVFSDVRFKNEADAIRAAGGIVIRVERDGAYPVNGHESETDLDDYDFNYVIDNNDDREDLQDAIRVRVSQENFKRGSGGAGVDDGTEHRPRMMSDDRLEPDLDVNGSTAYSAGEWADPECLPGAYRVASRV